MTWFCLRIESPLIQKEKKNQTQEGNQAKGGMKSGDFLYNRIKNVVPHIKFT